MDLGASSSPPPYDPPMGGGGGSVRVEAPPSDPATPPPPRPARGRPPKYPPGSRRPHRKRTPETGREARRDAPPPPPPPSAAPPPPPPPPAESWLPEEWKALRDQLPPPDEVAKAFLIGLASWASERQDDARPLVVCEKHVDRIARPLAQFILLSIPETLPNLTPQERAAAMLALACVPAVIHYTTLEPIPLRRTAQTGTPGSQTPPAPPEGDATEGGHG